jgi:hypothetical protein
VEVLLRWRQRWLRPVRHHDRAGAWIGRARAMRARAQEIRTSAPDASPMLQDFDTHFDGLLRAAKAHADRVLVIPQPWFDKEYSPDEAALMWHGGVGAAWSGRVTAYYSYQVLFDLMRRVHERIFAGADANGVEVVDVMQTLERSARTYYDTYHVTPEGSRVVATVVASAMLRAPALAAAPRATRNPIAPELTPSLVSALD